MRAVDGLQLRPFEEGHPYLTDPVLPGLLKRLLPQNVSEHVHPDLVRFGHEVDTAFRAASARAVPPTLTQYDQWGQRIDRLDTSEGWRSVRVLCQREGFPAIFYERRFGEYSRIWGFAKMLFVIGDSVEIFCPIAMTDGCARVIELLGTPEMKRDILPRLISRDPSLAFTSGQWMTERPGGSDVSQTETMAVPCKTADPHALGPAYTLDGFKWFSSATDSEVAVALARTGSPSAGSRSLSLFLVPLRLPLFPTPSCSSPTSNGILIHRLKSKIGTHILPTAELELNTSTAYLLGPLNTGVKNIAPVLNITRLYSAFTSLGHLRKCLSCALAYAQVREVGVQGSDGRRTRCLLKDVPLHVAHLASVTLTYRALAHLAFGTAHLMGRAECGVADAGEGARLRILTPVLKAFAAELAVRAMGEAMSAMGGQGYMEETGIGREIRDGLVELIWEGTTTVLSLDLARALRDPTTVNSFIFWSNTTLSHVPPHLLTRTALKGALSTLSSALHTLRMRSFSAPSSELMSRPMLMVLGYVASSVYLLEHAIWSSNSELQGEGEVDVTVFIRWVLESSLVSSLRELESLLGLDSEGTRQRTRDDVQITKL